MSDSDAVAAEVVEVAGATSPAEAVTTKELADSDGESTAEAQSPSAVSPQATSTSEPMPGAPQPTSVPADPNRKMPTVTAADVEEAMRDVVDPELGINIVDLGLVYGVTLDANMHAVLDMTLTSAACPLTDVIEDQTAAALEPITNGHTINWVWMPPWGPDKITDEGREMLRALGFNL